VKGRMFSHSFPGTIFFAAVVLSITGCGSSPDATEAVDSMGKFGIETAKVNDGIDAALESLDSLVTTQGDDLKTPFQAYSSQITALEEQAQVVKAQAQEMEAKGDEFFTAWEADTSSEGGVSPERRARLGQAYAKIKNDLIGARDAFQPFLGSLKDVQGYLKLDLSRNGLASVKDVAAKARADGDKVKARIESVLREINSVRGMLSTSAG
jgi:hypothetical protein